MSKLQERLNDQLDVEFKRIKQELEGMVNSMAYVEEARRRALDHLDNVVDVRAALKKMEA